jgi:hypothetical protein
VKKPSSEVRKKQDNCNSLLGEPPRADPVKVLNHRERQAKRKQEFAFRVLCLKSAVAVVRMAAITLLCWLFLAYSRPEFLEKILGYVVCAAGAYGWAHRNSKSGGGPCV